MRSFLPRSQASKHFVPRSLCVTSRRRSSSSMRIPLPVREKRGSSNKGDAFQRRAKLLGSPVGYTDRRTYGQVESATNVRFLPLSRLIDLARPMCAFQAVSPLASCVHCGRSHFCPPRSHSGVCPSSFNLHFCMLQAKYSRLLSCIFVYLFQ